MSSYLENLRKLGSIDKNEYEHLKSVVEKEELRRKVDNEIRNLSSLNNYNVKFERIGDVSVSNNGSLNALLKKKTKLFKWVKIYTYSKEDHLVSKFLWKMADDCHSEVEISTRRKDSLEVKGIVGSRSKIVGKLPNEIYEKVKDKNIDIDLDFVTNPYDLTVSIYEVSYTSLDAETSKFRGSKDKKQKENFVKHQKEYEDRKRKYIEELMTVINLYAKQK